MFVVKAEHGTDGSPPTAANILLNEVKHTTHTTMEGLKSSIKPISEYYEIIFIIIFYLRYISELHLKNYIPLGDATVHTLHNIKDLQESTVNNALNKIGDFQVSSKHYIPLINVTLSNLLHFSYTHSLVMYRTYIVNTSICSRRYVHAI